MEESTGRARGLAPRPSRKTLFAALLAALALAPRVAFAQSDPTAYEGHPIEDVRFEGLVKWSKFHLQARIETRPGQPFSALTFSKDLERLFRTGYFGAADPKTPPVDGRVELANEANPAGPVIVIFHCHERPPVQRVVFVGFDPLKRSEIDDIVKTRSMATIRQVTRVDDTTGLYDSYRATLDAKELKNKLVEKGYLYAEVDHKRQEEADGVTVTFTARPGPKVHVDSLVFEGAKQLDPNVVKDAEGANALETKEQRLFGLLEAGPFDRRALRRDFDRIARYYRSQGYLDAKVYLDRYEFSDDRESLKIHARVDEGERYNVQSVKIEGAHVVDDKKIYAELKLTAGRAFLGEDLRADIEKIKRMYADRAYIHAEVDVDFQYDVARKLVDLTYRITEGPRVRIDRIKVEGNDKTKEDVIRRELSFYPGEYFDATKVEDSIERLGRLRYFKDVRFDLDPGSAPGREDVVLKVEEARTGSFVVGGGISTNAGLFGNVALTQRNFDIANVPTSWRDVLDGHAFTGAGQTFSIQLQPGKDRSQYRVSFVEPWLGGFPVLLGLDAFVYDHVREDWLESRIGGSVSLGYRITQDLVAKMTYRFERVRVGDIQLFGTVPDAIAVAGNNYVSAMRFSLTYDQNLVDRYFILYGGYAATVSYEVAGLGGDARFSAVRIEANGQKTLIEWPSDQKWVLQLTGEAGYMTPFGGMDVPIYERFFAGGSHSIRGFAYRGVGPMFDDKPNGGDALWTATAEFSFPIFQQGRAQQPFVLRGVTFVDAGDVERRMRDVRGDTIRVAAGFGVRITLPIFPAPIALDFGWPILKERTDRPQVFSFSVGFGF